TVRNDPQERTAAEMTGWKRIWLCAAVLLSLCACGRSVGGLHTVPDMAEASPAEAVQAAGAGPTSVYAGAEMDFLMPLEEYSRERKYAPEFLMIHFTSAVVEHPDDPYGEEHIRALFTGYGVSTHYLIQRDGTVYCYVPEERVAWHAGVGEWLADPKYTNTMNEYAIGIELAAIGSEEDMEKYLPDGEYDTLDPALVGFTEEQYSTLEELVADLCGRYGIPQDRTHVIGHDAYSPEKHDPGTLFDWNRILPDGETEHTRP
ncbi:MAG: N-acetylmuramoyl-L-alanine amidase, partial [Clostridia bacterium]|nr:N-acetylmuramoyl-L-alanine amidase [Clostridia bacterium]